jgi:hypothetical protein
MCSSGGGPDAGERPTARTRRAARGRLGHSARRRLSRHGGADASGAASSGRGDCDPARRVSARTAAQPAGDITLNDWIGINYSDVAHLLVKELLIVYRCYIEYDTHIGSLFKIPHRVSTHPIANPASR